jgi:hypothetical protein
MARISVNGLDGLMDDLLAVAEIPDDVAEEMLDAEAAIVEEAQVYTGMKMGVYRSGETLRSITHGKMKRGKDGQRSKYVYPRGINEKGERNAAVAFINEFGAPQRGIQARPFIQTANELSADEAVKAAEDVYDKYLKSKNL